MKRTPLSPGSKPLQRRTPLKSTSGLATTAKPLKRTAVSPATAEQRAATKVCIVTGVNRDEGWTVDPAHLAARGGRGLGCDSVLCTVGLRRDVHEAFDRGDFDLLPHLLGHKLVPQIVHALEHYEGDLLGLSHRLTGERFVPDVRAAA